MNSDSDPTGSHETDDLKQTEANSVLTAEQTLNIERTVRRQLRRYAAFFGIANLIAIGGACVYILGVLPEIVTREVTDNVRSDTEDLQDVVRELVLSTTQTVGQLTTNVGRSKGDIVALDAALWGSMTVDQRARFSNANSADGRLKLPRAARFRAGDAFHLQAPAGGMDDLVDDPFLFDHCIVGEMVVVVNAVA